MVDCCPVVNKKIDNNQVYYEKITILFRPEKDFLGNPPTLRNLPR